MTTQAQATTTANSEPIVVGSVLLSVVQPSVSAVITERVKTDEGYRYAGNLIIGGEKVAGFSNFDLDEDPDWVLDSEPCDCGCSD